MLIRNTVLMKIAFAVASIFFMIMSFKNAQVLISLVSNISFLKTVIASAAIIGIAFLCFVLFRVIYRCETRAREKEISFWIFCLLLFVLSYVLRATWIAMIQTPQRSDYQLFYLATNQIAHNEDPSYLTSPYFHTWAYQVGFPAFMSPIARLFPNNMNALLFVNCAFESGTVLCVFYLLNKFFNRTSSFILCCLYLLIPYPYMLVPVFTNQLSSVFFMLLGVCVLFSKQEFAFSRCVIAALLLAISNVLRPEGILVTGAMGMMVLFRLVAKLKEEKLRERILRVMPVVVCCLVYVVSSMLISKAFEWSNLNPSGLKNYFPLYKFAVGFNEKNYGQYSKEDADYLMGLHATKPYEVRDEITRQFIRERLSIGSTRLIKLFSNKFDVMWTERYEQYPALMPYAEDRVISFFGVALKVSTFKDAVAFIQSICLLFLFLLGGLATVSSILRKELSPMVIFLSSFMVICIVVYTMIEVQKRYFYIAMPFLFLLASISLSDTALPCRIGEPVRPLLPICFGDVTLFFPVTYSHINAAMTPSL